jgi:hypothetical protein
MHMKPCCACEVEAPGEGGHVSPAIAKPEVFLTVKSLSCQVTPWGEYVSVGRFGVRPWNGTNKSD